MAPVVPHQSETAWKVCLLTLDSIAVLGTALRLWLRYRSSKLWWDDLCALIPTSTLIALMVFYDAGMAVFETPDFVTVKWHNHWNSSFLILVTVWWSRITIAVGLVRLFPSWGHSRHVAASLAGCFFCIWIFLTAFYPLTCNASAGWTKVNYLECTTIDTGNPNFVTVLAPTLSIILNFIGDSLLVICPLFMFWGLKLPSSERHLILVLFSSSAATLMVVVALTISFNVPFAYTPSRGILRGGLSHLECSVGMIVCNLLPVAGFLYRAYRSAKKRVPFVYRDSSSGSNKNSTSKSRSGTPHGVPTVTRSITVEVDTEDGSRHVIPLQDYVRRTQSESLNGPTLEGDDGVSEKVDGKVDSL